MEIFDTFNEIDWILGAIVLLSTLYGLWRGMIKEIFALAGWAAAFFCSLHYSDLVAAKLPLGGVGSLARTIISIGLITVACVFGAGLVGRILRSLLNKISIGWEDRILGLVFGFLRGALIAALLVYLGGSSEFVSKQIWWKNSVLVPVFEKGIVFCSPYLPQGLLNIKDLK